jgi:hypothetical protein
MTPEEFYNKMLELHAKEIEDGDTETTHYEADELMCKVLTELGYGAGVEKFREIYKWYA